jgi:hypothetical protein
VLGAEKADRDSKEVLGKQFVSKRVPYTRCSSGSPVGDGGNQEVSGHPEPILSHRGRKEIQGGLESLPQHRKAADQSTSRQERLFELVTGIEAGEKLDVM